MQVLLLLVALVVLRWAYFRLKWAYLARKWGCGPVKDVSNWKLGFDRYFQIIKARKEGFVQEHLRDAYSRVGVDTYQITTPFTVLMQTMNPENTKAMLATQFDDFRIGLRHEIFAPILGNGIFAVDGAPWKHARAILKPQFSRDQISHLALVERHIQHLAAHLRNARGQLVDIQRLFVRFTLDALLEFLFGESVQLLEDELIGCPPQDPVKEEFSSALKAAEWYITSRAMALDLYFLADGPAFRRLVRLVHRFTDYFVKKALELTPAEIARKRLEGYTFLYELVAQTRDPVALRDHLLNIMLAGRDTTLSLLLLTVFELARHPEAWERLKEAVYQAFGTGSAEDVADITFEKLKRCVYLRWVLQETLRLWPPVSQNFREARRDTTLPKGGGADGEKPIFVPKNTRVVFQVFATQRLERYFGKDAAEFRPERWADTAVGWLFLPFGSGPRICLGQQFALTEALYVLVRLAQMFPTLVGHDTEYPPRKTSGAIIRHHNGVNVSLC